MDGSGLRQLTQARPASDDVNPSWSPDGSKIAFWREDSGLMVVRPDGSGLGTLVPADTRYTPAWGHVAWSPDGTHLAFSGATLDTAGLWIVNANGRDAEQLAAVPEGDFGLSWSPYGRNIVFADRYNSWLNVINLSSRRIHTLPLKGRRLAGRPTARR
jgi:Tol biopolymer transport system component